MKKWWWCFNVNYLPLLALVAGAAIATQATANAKLGVLLNSPLLASCIAFSVSGILSVVAYISVASHYPQWSTLKAVPWYLWWGGSVFSAFAVAMFYYLIPRMGAGPMMVFALSGQLLLAVLFSHFGCFGSPVKPINFTTLLGVAAMILGMVLVNGETSHAA